MLPSLHKLHGAVGSDLRLHGACHSKGHMVRGPVDGGVDALYFGPASNIFARDLAGKPMEDITYDKPIDAAGALLLITCALTVSQSAFTPQQACCCA